MTPHARDPLDLRTLASRYASGQWTVAGVLAAVRERIATSKHPAVWIDLTPASDIESQIAAVTDRRAKGIAQPLFGVPFAVKDNIDVAGRPTTAACPAFAYTPERSATVVQRLCDAGAIVIGKTNLDQFATGLVGVRSPYGACHNVFDDRYLSGGSSSGSAVAVAAGMVSFALGTDTAGSGRVPAAFNNIVGLKPTKGVLSTAGVVPACRSLDCVSVFALTCEDAGAVASVADAYDPSDVFSRGPDERPAATLNGTAGFRFGVPDGDALRFFGSESGPALFARAVERLRELGGTPVKIDYAPFAAAARLLYEGPWVAERLAAIKDFLDRSPDALLSVTRTIIEGAKRLTAVDGFEGAYRLRALARVAAKQWQQMDVLLVPTAGRIYTLDEVEREPIALNTNLGYYTNFVNLLDLCAVAVPGGFGPDGLPAGISLIAPAGYDLALLTLGGRFHRSLGLTMGATGHPLPAAETNGDTRMTTKPDVGRVQLAVVGAHLSGQPLNSQLTDRAASLVRTCKTSAKYRLYALPGTTPPKPGLVRVSEGNGHAPSGIEVEVWEMTAEAFGTFVAAIPPPLGVGTIELEDGSSLKGFLCEGYATTGARDISEFGGWRAFLQTGRSVSPAQ